MNSDLEKAKQEIFEYIDNLTLSESSYQTILNIMNNTSDKLFAKIMEEIKDGNLCFEDFTGVFGDTLNFESYFDNQYNTVQQQLAFSDAVERLQMNNIVNSVIKSQILTTQTDILEIERENILTDIFQNISERTPAEQVHIANVMEKVLSDSKTKDEFMNSLILSLDDFVVPMDYKNIKLNSFDIKYMEDNNMSEVEMKKLKATTIFLENELTIQEED